MLTTVERIRQSTFEYLHCTLCRHTGEEKERSGTDWDSVIYSDLPSMDLTGKKVNPFSADHE